MLELRAVDGAADERHADGGKGMRIYISLTPHANHALRFEVCRYSTCSTQVAFSHDELGLMYYSSYEIEIV